jgi:hypothetical protein
MQEKIYSVFKKYVLQKGKVYGCIFPMIILSMIPSCKEKNINGHDVNVMDSNLLVNVDTTNSNYEIEEVVSKNIDSRVEQVVTTVPTQVPTPTLTPEQMELQKYNECFKLYDYCYIDKNRDRYIEYFKEYPDISSLDAMTYVNIGLDNNYYTNITDIANPSSSLVICNKYNKLPSDYVPNEYPKINGDGTSEVNYRALKGASGDAFNEMKKAAAEKGLNIFPASA